jgi:hypothetical protein
MRCPSKVPAAWLPSTVGFKPSHTGGQRSHSEARPAPTSNMPVFRTVPVAHAGTY